MDVEEYLSTAYINGVNVKNLVTRNTEQHIPGKLTFTEVSVYNDIPVGNLVNGVKLENFIKSNLIVRLQISLKKIYSTKNKLQNGTDQEISSQISFTNNAIIYESLVIDDDGTINGLHFDKLVTTSTDQNLSAVYVFEGESNSIERSLRIYRFLNDINVTDWFSNALKKYSNETQYINSEIDIDGDLTFVRDVGGNGSVNGLDFPSVVGALEERKRKKYGLEKDTVV